MTRTTLPLLSLLFALEASSLLAQSPASPPVVPSRRACPGEPPGNIASVDCDYTIRMRGKDLVAGSITDQAMLGAIVFSGMAQIRNDPAEWHRSWEGFGYRVGSRYAQNLTKGLTEFGIGEAMRTDPRHVSYASDPRTTKLPTAGRRVGHAFLDFLTVRRSSVAGDGTRLPNVPLFAGAAASGLVGNLWYPDSATGPRQIALRAGGSIATAIGASFYTEFSPEIGRLLGGIFKRGRTPAPPKASH